ncbi:MAG: oligopeptide transporter, OPT family [Tissierellales bacterium]|nr:oligopeptide transporter, OPT family [Tissierellales bacterium]
MERKEDFKPYIPAERIMPEFSVVSILLGIFLCIVFGAANAYIGLRVGMTVSASIPAAVLSMGIIRGIMKRDSILENNMVQTIGSAGESLAAGAIFTMPALFLWADELGMAAPSILRISAISLAGGLLGVFFMIPLRKALIVNEHGVLPYPEGTACAEVLIAGETGGNKAKTVFQGLGIGSLFKFITDGIKLFPSEIEWAIPGFRGAAIGMDTLPALLGVGFIVGPQIAAFMLAGAVLGWLVIIPLISHLGQFVPEIIYPATAPLQELVLSEGGYWSVWNNYIRYIGAGAVAFGGILSLIKSLPLIVRTFKDALGNLKSTAGQQQTTLRTEEDMSLKIVIIGILAIVILIGITDIIPVGIIGALVIAVFGFFFATVSSRLVGIIGSSNNPVSGMTIATLLITSIIFKATGFVGEAGMIGAISVGSVICIIAAMAGDMSQDLKTGFLVGATPKKQQIGEMIGAVVSALVIGYILLLLNRAWGFGTPELPAPQATMMKMVVEGVMGGQLPWPLVFIGVGIGIVVELLGIQILPFAVGLYLPIHLSTPIMLGGIIRGLLEKRHKEDKELDNKVESGILFSSGLIAGEGVIGILLAVFAIIPLSSEISLGEKIAIGNNVLGQWGSLILFLGLAYILVRKSFYAKKEN